MAGAFPAYRTASTQETRHAWIAISTSPGGFRLPLEVAVGVVAHRIKHDQVRRLALRVIAGDAALVLDMERAGSVLGIG
jgi:hypothetical protein